MENQSWENIVRIFCGISHRSECYCEFLEFWIAKEYQINVQTKLKMWLIDCHIKWILEHIQKKLEPILTEFIVRRKFKKKWHTATILQLYKYHQCVVWIAHEQQKNLWKTVYLISSDEIIRAILRICEDIITEKQRTNYIIATKNKRYQASQFMSITFCFNGVLILL